MKEKANLGISIAKLDSDIPLQLILESDGQHTRDSLHDGRFSVCDVSDGSYSAKPVSGAQNRGGMSTSVARATRRRDEADLS